MKNIFIVFAAMVCYLYPAATVAQIGKVGINTSSPQAMLHVKDSSVLFTSPVSLPVSPGDPPASGAGNRLMWYADKAAFRAGRVTGLNWDKDSIGVSSTAFGFNVKSTATNSVAMGNAAFATGTNAFAAGNLTIASGTTSTALGRQTQAIGNYSTATGYLTVSSGIASFTAGQQTTANFDNATAFGLQTLASGSSSMATGLNTQAIGQASFAGGYGSIAGNIGSVGLGFESNASGAYAIAAGDHTIASGESSFTTGKNTNATGNYSFSGGFLSSATGNTSFAFGEQAIAMGSGSVAMGYQSLADGLNAFAIGNSARARGDFSIAVGNNTYAKSFASLVIGKYNDTTNMISPDSWNLTDPIFVIGNGISGATSNLLTVFKNGRVTLNTITGSQAGLEINGTVRLGASGTLLNEIIKRTVGMGPFAIPANGSLQVTTPSTVSSPDCTIHISPSQDLPDGLIIAYVRANQNIPYTITFKFVNTTGAVINLGIMDYYIGIIR
jgi:hypothetical protein